MFSFLQRTVLSPAERKDENLMPLSDQHVVINPDFNNSPVSRPSTSIVTKTRKSNTLNGKKIKENMPQQIKIKEEAAEYPRTNSTLPKKRNSIKSYFDKSSQQETLNKKSRSEIAGSRRRQTICIVPKDNDESAPMISIPYIAVECETIITTEVKEEVISQELVQKTTVEVDESTSFPKVSTEEPLQTSIELTEQTQKSRRKSEPMTVSNIKKQNGIVTKRKISLDLSTKSKKLRKEVPEVHEEKVVKVHKATEKVVEEVIEDIWYVTVSKVRYEYAMVFLVKWDGFPPTENTYEPFEHVSHAEVLQEFVNRKFETHQDRIDKAIKEFLKDNDTYNKHCTKSKNFIMNKISKLNILRYKCSILAYIYTYKKIPNHSDFMRLLKYHSVLYNWYTKIEEQNENNRITAKKLMKMERKSFHIQIKNSIDFDVLPDFEYLTTVENPFKKDLKFGCQCTNCTKDSGCCPQFLGFENVYDVDHRILATQHQMIVECNEYCSCEDSCVNRPKKTNVSLEIFKTQDRGWSVRTLDPIPAGTFVVEYTGELIDQAEAQKRYVAYSKTRSTYLFDLDYNELNEATYSIDATNKGNLSRFINHSCEANLQTWPATSCNEKREMHRLYYFSLRKIQAGEELSVDYFGGVHHGSPIIRPTDSVTCKCGAATCRGFTF